jgi:hypothetical protein
MTQNISTDERKVYLKKSRKYGFKNPNYYCFGRNLIRLLP